MSKKTEKAAKKALRRGQSAPNRARWIVPAAMVVSAGILSLATLSLWVAFDSSQSNFSLVTSDQAESLEQSLDFDSVGAAASSRIQVHFTQPQVSGTRYQLAASSTYQNCFSTVNYLSGSRTCQIKDSGKGLTVAIVPTTFQGYSNHFLGGKKLAAVWQFEPKIEGCDTLKKEENFYLIKKERVVWLCKINAGEENRQISVDPQIQDNEKRIFISKNKWQSF